MHICTNIFSSIRPLLLVQMVLCPWYQFFQDTNHLNYLSLLSDVLEEAPMLDTPENLVVVRDGLTFSPIYLAHMKVSNDFLA